jgi:hypothetical protein
MVLMDQAIAELIQAGTIDVDEARTHLYDPRNVQDLGRSLG